MGLTGLAKHMRGLGEENLYLLTKLMTMSSADFLEEWFETEVLKATLSSSGIIGTFLGPRSPGTAYVLLHHYMGEIDGAFRAWGFAKGGTGGLANAIANSAKAFGVEIRTEASVTNVMVKNGAAIGVVLQNGEEYYANVIVSSLDPKLTFLKLVDPKQLPDDLVSAIQKFNIRGSSGKVNLALDALPNFACMPGAGPHLAGAFSISPSINYLERAYDDAKYGDFSHKPYIDVILPSVIDPDMAPPGKHVMSCFVQYAPYRLREGTWEQKREAFGDAVVNTLAEYIPNLKDIILHRQVMTPWDIEQTVGLSQGNIFQGELTLSQLFFLRPAAGYAKFRTPIRNYYQCGSGTHPGGGITGAPGRLAALEILKEAK
ncbi:NAD(P)/FAD-dependent oxidoreductase, partial [candidate division KSB1 bacterium]|nr:NAD(P)/FAD-dependent oxidoreductase [candidate division KSB1 bacterium]